MPVQPMSVLRYMVTVFVSCLERGFSCRNFGSPQIWGRLLGSAPNVKPPSGRDPGPADLRSVQHACVLALEEFEGLARLRRLVVGAAVSNSGAVDQFGDPDLAAGQGTCRSLRRTSRFTYS